MVNLRNFIATVHITARPHPHTSFSSDDPIHIIKCLHSCIYAPSSDCPRPSLYLTPIFSSPPSRHLPFNPADTVTGNIHHVKMPCPSCHLSAYHASAPPGGWTGCHGKHIPCWEYLCSTLTSSPVCLEPSLTSSPYYSPPSNTTTYVHTHIPLFLSLIAALLTPLPPPPITTTSPTSAGNYLV